MAGAVRCYHYPKQRLAVTQRNYAKSLNGVWKTTTKASTVMCCECGKTWRTTASYVDQLPDAPDEWHKFQPPYDFGVSL